LVNALERFQQSPDYQFALKGGIGGAGQFGGGQGRRSRRQPDRAQTEYGSGLATQNLQGYLTRLSGMSGQGIQAGGYLGQIGTGVGLSGRRDRPITWRTRTMAAGTAEASGISA
jgi:hypothetical protein